MKLYFNIHNLVKITVQSSIAYKTDIALAHWREFQVPSIDEGDIDICIYDYCECPKFKDPVLTHTISDGDHYADNYLNIIPMKCCFNFVDRPYTVYCDYFSIPPNLMVELVLVGKGHSLIHSGGVKYKERNFLLPAFAGIGKTTVVSTLVRNGGKLFGDDWNIVNSSDMYGYPMDFSVYPFHLDILGIKDRKIERDFARTRVLDTITGRLSKYKFRAIKLLVLVLNSLKTGAVNMPPRKIFGGDCLARVGPIDRVLYLCKVQNGLTEITCETMDAADLAGICANITFLEWAQCLGILYAYSALSEFSMHAFFNSIRGTLQQVFAAHECCQVKIPEGLDRRALQEQLIRLLAA